MKIKLLNVSFSPNLGDGVLVDCLSWGCAQDSANASISSVDLAGRTGLGGWAGSRSSILRGLSLLPSGARRVLVGTALRLKLRLQLRDFYRRELAEADAVVVGGGHLFSDTDLNFPLKLRAALDVAAECEIPVWVYGCGVSGRWSHAGRRLFQDAVRSPRLVAAFVRDDFSQRMWNAHLRSSSGVDASVVRDPGLLCSRVYGAGRSTESEQRAIGVGVIAPIALRYHGADIRRDTLTSWFVTLIEGVLESGRTVTLISNGSPEDTDYGELLMDALRRRRTDTAAITFSTHREPSALARTFASLSCFIGFRLHGLICAHSFGVPTYALDWDDKIGSFMASIDRPQYRYDVRFTAAKTLVSLLLAEQPVLSKGAVDESLAGIQKLCRSIAERLERSS